jgi:hypothetical protein
MTYLYLIQKKEFIDKNIYKIGLLKSIDRINKNHKIILLIKDEYNLINLKTLNTIMMSKFQKLKKNYFIGNENSIKYFMSQYIKNLYLNKSHNIFNTNNYETIKTIILSDKPDSYKYEQISNLCSKKLEVRNIIFDSCLTNTEKYELINDILHNNKIVNFGNENIDHIDKDEILDSFNNCNFIDVLNKYVQLVHFDRSHPENHNINYDDKDIKIYNNFEWQSNDTSNLMHKILMSTIKKIYLIVFVHTIQNSENDLLYAKGLLTLKKINNLLI